MATFSGQRETIDRDLELTLHPVLSFLHSCGLDVSQFPVITLLVETTEKHFRTHRVCIPLRLPTQPGVIYESFCRITRILEIPSTQSGSHRKFLEIEWTIIEQPQVEEDEHPAYSFLAGEIQCIACRDFFAPEPQIIDERSVNVVCPHCMARWTVNVDHPKRDQGIVELLLDLNRINPLKLKSTLNDWEFQIVQANDSQYYKYFAYHCEALDQGSSLDWLFGEVKGWKALPSSPLRDFEALARSLVNHIVIHYFRTASFAPHLNELEKTEIQRKTDVAVKKEQAPVQEISEASPAPTNVAPMRTPSLTPSKPFQWKDFFSKMAFACTGAAAVVFIYAILAQNISPKVPTIQNKTEISEVKPIQIPEKIAAVENKTEVNEVVEKKQAVAAAAKPAVQKKEPSKSIVATKEKEFPKKEIQNHETPLSALQEKIETTLRRAKFELSLQHSAEAIAEFKKVLELDPKNAIAYFHLGSLYIDEKQFNEATSALKTFLQLAEKADPERSSAYLKLGIAYSYNKACQEDKKCESAIQNFESFLSLAATDSPARSQVESLIQALKDQDTVPASVAARQ